MATMGLEFRNRDAYSEFAGLNMDNSRIYLSDETVWLDVATALARAAGIDEESVLLGRSGEYQFEDAGSYDGITVVLRDGLGPGDFVDEYGVVIGGERLLRFVGDSLTLLCRLADELGQDILVDQCEFADGYWLIRPGGDVTSVSVIEPEEYGAGGIRVVRRDEVNKGFPLPKPKPSAKPGGEGES